jgi:hypothetical protein
MPTNVIEGVNLIEDEDETVIRVDLRVPLEALPTIDATRPRTLTIDLPRVANGIGKILNLSGAGVEGVRLEADAGASRLVIDLTATLEHELQKNGRSLLVVLKGVEAAKTAATRSPPGDLAEASAAARLPGSAPVSASVGAPINALTGPDAGSVGKSDELARTRNTDWLSPEQAAQSRRK